MSPTLQAWIDGGCYWTWRGHRIFFRREGSGPTVLLIHGYPVGSYDWHTLWRSLSQRCDAVTLDFLGLGVSDKPEREVYRLTSHVELLFDFLHAQGITEAHLVAHDLGVSVMQMFLHELKQPGRPRFKPLTLTALNGGLMPHAYRPRLIQRLLASPLGPWLGRNLSRRSFHKAIQRLFSDRYPPSLELLDDFWDLVRHAEGLRTSHLVGAFWKERRAHAEALLAATLANRERLRLINGALDPNSGRHMIEAYLEHDPHACVDWLEDSGHWPQLEQPERVAELLLSRI